MTVRTSRNDFFATRLEHLVPRAALNQVNHVRQQVNNAFERLGGALGAAGEFDEQSAGLRMLAMLSRRAGDVHAYSYSGTLRIGGGVA